MYKQVLQGAEGLHQTIHGAQPQAGQHRPAQQEGEKLHMRG